MKSKYWWFGRFSVWAKICKFIGKYPDWVVQRLVRVDVCKTSKRLPVSICREKNLVINVLRGELEVPDRSCPLKHITYYLVYVCKSTRKIASPSCPDTYQVKVTEAEYAKMVGCLEHTEEAKGPEDGKKDC